MLLSFSDFLVFKQMFLDYKAVSIVVPSPSHHPVSPLAVCTVKGGGLVSNSSLL